MDSSDAMIDELLIAFHEGLPRYDTPEELLGVLPLRRHVFANEHNPFQFAHHRVAGIGVAALVCYYSENDHNLHAVIARRSSSVSTWKETWHVFPSGMLGTRFIDFDGYRSTDVKLAMLAEFGEELCSEDALEERSVAREFVSEFADERLGRFDSELIFTGVAFDLLNLRPEICSVILIRDPKWIRETRIIPNYEIRRGTLTHPAVGTSDQAAATRFLPAETVPSGAAALWCGIDAVRARFERRGTTIEWR
jgi:hypothetical protein